MNIVFISVAQYNYVWELTQLLTIIGQNEEVIYMVDDLIEHFVMNTINITDEIDKRNIVIICLLICISLLIVLLIYKSL